MWGGLLKDLVRYVRRRGKKSRIISTIVGRPRGEGGRGGGTGLGEGGGSNTRVWRGQKILVGITPSSIAHACLRVVRKLNPKGSFVDFVLSTHTKRST